MGVSLQIYRIRIGTYLSKCRTGTSGTISKNNCHNPNTAYRTSILIFLLFSTMLPIVYHINPTIFSPPIQHPPAYSCTDGAISCTRYAGPSEIPSCLQAPSSWLTKQQTNSKVKAKNGNRGQRGRGIKIVTWNKGNSLLQNKHPEIENVIASHHPHILGLSEANFMMNTDPMTVQHDDYILHTAPTLDNPTLGVSRIVVYTHSSLKVKRRPDLEDSTISAIWLEVGMP